MTGPALSVATPGLFVTFEGVDGAGKSTQLRATETRLAAEGWDVVATREPGGAPGAEEIRGLLVSGAVDRWSAETELLLFNAARRDHLEVTIEPALARGAVVLCDRYVDSTRAYQAAGRGRSSRLVDDLHRLVIGRDPDLTVIFDIDPGRAAERRAPPEAAMPESGEETRFERFGLGFQSTLRAAYLAIADADPARCRVVDAEAPADRIADQTVALIRAAWNARRGGGSG